MKFQWGHSNGCMKYRYGLGKWAIFDQYLWETVQDMNIPQKDDKKSHVIYRTVSCPVTLSDPTPSMPRTRTSQLNHTVISLHGHVVTRSTRHMTKPPQCRAVRFGYLGLMSLYHSDNSYLWAWKLERNETLHIHVQHGKILQRVQSRSHRRRRSSWMRRMLGHKYARHNAVRHDGQLVTRFYGATSWPCDELTGSHRDSTSYGPLENPGR